MRLALQYYACMYDAKRALLKELEHFRLPQAARILPTSFDPEDPELTGFPVPTDFSWESLSYALRESGAKKGILVRLPLFWQVESLIYAAGKEAGIPLFSNERENMPVGGAALKAGEVDAVLTDAVDAPVFAQFLREKGAAPKVWCIVHSCESADWSGSVIGEKVAQQVHLFPGLPILSQCTALWGTNAFHRRKEFLWEGEHLTTPDSYPFMLARYTLPFRVRDEGFCQCGESIVKRLS